MWLSIGLDECSRETARRALSLLDRKATSTGECSIKILVACRNSADLLQGLPISFHVELTSDITRDDMGCYIKDAVGRAIASQDLQLRDPKLKDYIISKLNTKSQGMFLWVHFQIQELCEARTDSSKTYVLEHLPKDLGETYARIATRICASPERRKLASRVFIWVESAKRPLCITEMREAVAFEAIDTKWDASKIPTETALTGACGGLVVCDAIEQTVLFAHHTIPEWLHSHVLGHAIISYRTQSSDVYLRNQLAMRPQATDQETKGRVLDPAYRRSLNNDVSYLFAPLIFHNP